MEWIITWPIGLGVGYYATGAVLNFVNKRGKNNGLRV